MATSGSTKMNDVDLLLESIRGQLEELPDFGQIQLHLTKHLGQFGKREVVKITSIKFTDNEPNVSATTAIYQMIKAVADAKETGTLTFSINMKQGRAEQMSVQDFKRI